MPVVQLNGTDIHYEVAGDGPPLILVHGSWSDRNTWLQVIPGLAQTNRVVAYDRCGHGLSDKAGRTSRRAHEDDLAALIELLDCGPVDIVGTSYGGCIVIGLATRRPELVRSLIAHDPGLISVVADDPAAQPILRETQANFEVVASLVADGKNEAGAREFVERVALGPGAWDLLPEPLRQTMIDCAHTFVLEVGDPEGGSVDQEALAALEMPVLLTQGKESPEWFAPIVAGLAQLIPGVEVGTFRDGGHAPHLTHADEYVTVTTQFLARTREAAVVR